MVTNTDRFEHADDPNQPNLEQHVVSGALQAEFDKKFARCMCSTLTSLHRLKNAELKSALAVLGATPTSVYKTGGPLLDEAYSAAVDAVISGINEFTSICITMDGSKKRYCEQGSPLITVTILLPDCTALFWKACILDTVTIQLVLDSMQLCTSGF